jgi:alkylation response protein AidB-like acyl-CoA dehydrogenase
MSLSSSIKDAAQVAQCLADNAAKIDIEGAFPKEEFVWLKEVGLLAAPVPEHFGGRGLGTASGSTPSLLKVLWHIGRGNLAVGRLYEGHVNALQLVHWFGSEAQQKRWFSDALEGRIFAVWNTQAGDGIRFRGEGSQVEMQGAKTFCSGAGEVLRPIVTGELEGAGWQMAIVPMNKVETCIDTSWWQPLGMRASASFKTDFSGAKIGTEDLLGKPGDYYQQPLFSGGAIRFCAVQLGGAAALFDETRRFLRECGRSEDVFQRARLGQMAAKIESGTQWLERAGQLWDSSPSAEKMVAFAAMMRVATEEICVAILEMCEKSVGARGLMRSLPFERIGRDLTIYLKQPHLDEIPVRVGKYVLENELRSDEIWL